MHDYVAVIHDDPAVAGKALQFAFLLMLLADVFNDGFSERVYHAVAAASANHKVIGERNDFFQVYQDDIFAFFIFERVYDFTCKFKCVQGSPHGIV